MSAGLGFKDFSTGEVLTAADVDGYLMQGIWVFTNAAARDAAVTSPQEGNACYLKDTDVIQVYTGSAWAAQSASNPISANIVDAKGDLIVGTAADTVSKLSVGANGTTLVADSGETTGLRWSTPTSGGMTLLETLTLSGASTTSSTIPGTHKHLQLVFRQALPATDGAYLQLRFNGNSGTVYRVSGTKEQINFDFNATQIDVGNARDNTTSNSNEIITLYDYTSTTWKNLISTGIVNNPTTTANYNGYSSYGGQIGITSAITSVTVFFSSGNITSGTCLIYGVS